MQPQPSREPSLQLVKPVEIHCGNMPELAGRGRHHKKSADQEALERLVESGADCWMEIPLNGRKPESVASSWRNLVNRTKAPVKVSKAVDGRLIAYVTPAVSRR